MSTKAADIYEHIWKSNNNNLPGFAILEIILKVR